jgi:pyruvate formate lyase activating enzyme
MGSHPSVVRALIADGLLDLLAMDIKSSWLRCAEAAGLTASALDTETLQETVAILRESGIEHQL